MDQHHWYAIIRHHSIDVEISEEGVCRKLTFSVNVASMQTRSNGLKVGHLSKDPSAKLEVVSKESFSACLTRYQVTKDDARNLASTMSPTTWNSFIKCEGCSCVCPLIPGCPRHQD